MRAILWFSGRLGFYAIPAGTSILKTKQGCKLSSFAQVALAMPPLTYCVGNGHMMRKYSSLDVKSETTLWRMLPPSRRNESRSNITLKGYIYRYPAAISLSSVAKSRMCRNSDMANVNNRRRWSEVEPHFPTTNPKHKGGHPLGLFRSVVLFRRVCCPYRTPEH